MSRSKCPALDAELPKVMVRMAIGPPPPVGARQPAKDGMFREYTAVRNFGELLQKLVEPVPVCLKIDGLGAFQFLVRLAHGRDTGWPSERKPQRHDLQ